MDQLRNLCCILEKLRVDGGELGETHIGLGNVGHKAVGKDQGGTQKPPVEAGDNLRHARCAVDILADNTSACVEGDEQALGALGPQRREVNEKGHQSLAQLLGRQKAGLFAGRGCEPAEQVLEQFACIFW